MNNDDFQKLGEILDAAVRRSAVLPIVSLSLSVVALLISGFCLLHRLGVL